jgi:hypothetical protein
MKMLDGFMEKMTSILDDAKQAAKERDNQQWEYLMAAPGQSMDTAWLNYQGSQRWELVQVIVGGGAIFKRPKLEEANEA